MSIRQTLPLSALLSIALLACPASDPSHGGGGGGGGGPVPPVASRFFLPTASDVDNTVNPRIEADGTGALHMLYPAYAIGNAYYSYCQADCSAEDKARSVKLETDGTVDNAMLA